MHVDDENTVALAAEALRTGGVILYPTDTLYGLGADALSDEALAKVVAIKGRDEKKPIHAIVADVEMVMKYGDVSERVRQLMDTYPKGKVTFIVRKNIGFDTGIFKGIDTFGFRIPDHPFCISLCRAFGGPITATSANKAGVAPEHSLDAILAQLGAEMHVIDLAIDGGNSPIGLPSTILDYSQGEPKVLREGAFPMLQLGL